MTKENADFFEAAARRTSRTGQDGVNWFMTEVMRLLRIRAGVDACALTPAALAELSLVDEGVISGPKELF